MMMIDMLRRLRHNHHHRVALSSPNEVFRIVNAVNASITSQGTARGPATKATRVFSNTLSCRVRMLNIQNVAMCYKLPSLAGNTSSTTAILRCFHVPRRRMETSAKESARASTTTTTVPMDTVSSAYFSKVDAGLLQRDEAQVVLAAKLDALHKSLQSHSRPKIHAPVKSSKSRMYALTNNSLPFSKSQRYRGRGGRNDDDTSNFFGKLMARWLDSAKSYVHKIRLFKSVASPPPIKSMYIHGSVGVGKSFLMDLFHATLTSSSSPSTAIKSRRVHFHEFMLNIHHSIHAFKQQQKLQEADPNTSPAAAATASDDAIPQIAFQMAQEIRVLCLDEFQVTDIADAMILKRLLTLLLLEYQVVLIMTSNRPPHALYEGGINRSLFVPFIHNVLEPCCDIVSMDTHHDYRQDTPNATKKHSDDTETTNDDALDQSYFWPDNEETQCYLEAIFTSYQTMESPPNHNNKNNDNNTTTSFTTSTHDHSPELSIPVMFGRTVKVSRHNDVCAWFNFPDLCHLPLGAADYISLCQRFPVLIINHVPCCTAQYYNEARRFVTLIDACYESHTRLVLATSVPISELLVAFDAHVESFDGDEEMEEAGTTTTTSTQSPSSSPTMSSFVVGEGGSSSSHATTMIQLPSNNDNDNVMEWSATGRIGVSLAQLSSVKEVSFSFQRASSRLAEMNGPNWGRIRSM